MVFDSRFVFPDNVLNAINTHECDFCRRSIIYNILLRRSNLRNSPLPGLRCFQQAGGALAVAKCAGDERHRTHGGISGDVRSDRGHCTNFLFCRGSLGRQARKVQACRCAILKFALLMRPEGNSCWERLTKFRCARRRCAWDI